jgi:2-dehydropantoate 2-reductase
VALEPHSDVLAEGEMVLFWRVALKPGRTPPEAVMESGGADEWFLCESRDRRANTEGPARRSDAGDPAPVAVRKIEALVGSVVELGALTHTPTPYISAVYACASLLAKTLNAQHGKLHISS